MAKKSDSIVIKKYANRRLYNTGTSTYVTLEDLATMVKSEDEFVVVDAKTGDDITRSVLTQIIFEQEGKGQNLLPVTFLRSLIQFYGDSMQTIVPSYLDHSMEAFRNQQHKYREQLANAFGPQAALDAINEQTRRNTEMFQKAMQMFIPFNAGETPAEGEVTSDENAVSQDDIDAMKEQIDTMQAQLKAMSKTKD